MWKVILLCLLLQTISVSAQFGWLKKLFRSSKSKSSSSSKGATKLDEIHMEADGLITSKGYPFEKHWVTTVDGYILELHRIPHGRMSQSTAGNRPVALLQHGVFGSSKEWLLNSAEQSLPFLLADAGVDVWLGNNRGNSYSKNHTTLSTKQKEFWDFSWDEMAKYDLPAEINYILDATNNKQLYYVGFSQGTTIGFAKFSEDQQLAKKVKHFIALAPVAHVGHITSGLRKLMPFSKSMKKFLDLFGGGQVKGNTAFTKTMSNLFCRGFVKKLCMKGHSFIMGDTEGQSINKSRLALYNAQSATITSAKVLMQWVQGVKTNKFQHFDHGARGNFWRYGQTTPPLYYPGNITVPVALFTGGNDALADPTDVSWLLTQINVTHHIDIPWYNHQGLVLGYDAKDVAYPYLIPIITGKPWTP
ncbi:lipase [Elysia marginata]|uniref:Lipase n=1 Tax=Elysia marginata TaxID=1093978 RepID=A0AAV4HF42_9GAST|nr:lipase [Elysia marginata]